MMLGFPQENLTCYYTAFSFPIQVSYERESLQREQRTGPSPGQKDARERPLYRIPTVQAFPQWWKGVFIFSDKADRKK